MSDHPPIGPGQPTPPQLTTPGAGNSTPASLADGPPPSSYALLPDRPATAPILIAWGAEVSYDIDSGLRSSPLAGPAGSGKSAFWRVHGGVCRKVVTFTCQAIGGKPEIPSPNTGSGNEVLILRRLAPQTPQMNQDGLPIWTVVGQYVYNLQVPPGDNDALGIGRHPLSVLPPELNTLTMSDFSKMLGAAVVTNYTSGGAAALGF